MGWRLKRGSLTNWGVELSNVEDLVDLDDLRAGGVSGEIEGGDGEGVTTSVGLSSIDGIIRSAHGGKSAGLSDLSLLVDVLDVVE
jgi:hypothetical protein